MTFLTPITILLVFDVVERLAGSRCALHAYFDRPQDAAVLTPSAAVAEYDEFRGITAFMPTRDFYRSKDQSPSGQAYHWNSNAEKYYLIGEEMGQAMLKLVKKPQTRS